ncbi:MAG: acetolactate synthase [Phycisphaeraceae bacterium]
MSQAPVSDAITYGYEPPRNTQFSVFLDNRVGKLLDLVQVFHGQQAVLAGLSVVDATDHAVVRLLTSRADLSRRLLERHRLPFSEAEILAVELGRGKTLAELCRTLLGAELNIYYAYPLLIQPRGLPVIALHTDDLLLSAQLLRRKLFTLLAENDLGDNASRGTEGNPNYPTPE